MDLKSKRLKDSRFRADKAFAEHIITSRLIQPPFYSWRCGSGSVHYYFNITIEPGRIFVAGDIGDIIFERQADMISWLEGAIHDPHYMAGKVPSCIPTTEYDSNMAKQWIAENRHRMSLEAFRDIRRVIENEEDEGLVYSTIASLGFDSDLPSFRNYNYNFLWCYHAVRWFYTMARAGQIPGLEFLSKKECVHADPSASR